MLGRVLHWVYCLPLGYAVLLALSATAVFLWLRRRWGQKRWWAPAVMALLLCWGAVMVINTVSGRSQYIRQLSLIPLRTYYTVLTGGEQELIRSSFMNVLLFYPGGLLAMSLLPREKRLWLIPVFLMLSVAVEVSQYWFCLGVTETDDVIHNTLGAVLGLLALRQYEKYN